MKFNRDGAVLETKLEAQEEALRQWGRSLPGPVDITLIASGDRRTDSFVSFCTMLDRLVPAVKVGEETAEGEALPGIRVGQLWTFHMVPEENELTPFLDLLSKVASGDAGLSEELCAVLDQVSVPSLVDIYVTTRCPNCPAVMSRITPFPLVNPHIALQVIDGSLFPERAEAQAVRAVPTVILADGIRFTGQVPAGEVADGLVQGDPARMGAEAFARMIRAGDAEGLAGMMLDRGRVFPGVLDLLAGNLFSVRLGAMVAMETVAEHNPELAREALEPLWDRMGKADLSAKGDVVYLIGELGDARWKARLEGLLERTEEPDLQDAVREALEGLEAGDA